MKLKVYVEYAWYGILLYAFLTFLAYYMGKDVGLFSLARFTAVWVIWYPFNLWIAFKHKDKEKRL